MTNPLSDPSQRPPNQIRRNKAYRGRDDDWIRDYLHSAKVCTVTTLWDDMPFNNPTLFWYDEEAHRVIFHSNIILGDILITEVYHKKEKNLDFSMLEIYLLQITMIIVIVTFYIGSGVMTDMFQLQYVLFFILGGLLAIVPYSYSKLKGKKTRETY